MALRASNLNIALAHSGIDEVLKLQGKDETSIFRRYVDVISNKMEYYRLQTMGGLGPATPVNQGQGIGFDDYTTPFRKDYYPLKYGVGFGITTEALERDPYNVWKQKANDMARSIKLAQEISCASMINQATSGTFTCPDGVTFASASHLRATGTYSNILVGNSPLSITALESAVNQDLAQVDHVGMPVMYSGTYSLLVPPALAQLAQRLVKAAYLPQSNDNDPNVVAGSVTNVVVNPFFTSTTAWAIVANEKWYNPMKMVMNRETRLREMEDVPHDRYVFAAFVNPASCRKNLAFTLVV